MTDEPEHARQPTPTAVMVDRFFTWGHQKFVPKIWCAEDTSHWTWRLVDLLWIDCACCFMFRSMIVGAAGALFLRGVASFFLG